MSIRDQILRALCGTTVMSAALMAACGDEDTLDGNNASAWGVGEGESTRTTTPATNNTSPPRTTPTTQPPVPQACDVPSEPDRWLPYEGWAQDWSLDASSLHVVCENAGESVGCKSPEIMDKQERAAFVERALPSSSFCGPPDAYYRASGENGGTFCGPIFNLDDAHSGHCCYVVSLEFSQCVEGRPLVIEGEVVLAAVTQRDGWCQPTDAQVAHGLPEAVREQIAAGWAESGVHEHASVASFARFVMELMALGAPADLVRDATRAIEDEIRHAASCFGLASAYAGVALGPGELRVEGSMTHAGDWAHLLTSTIMEGCIGETLAACEAQWLVRQARPEAVRQALTEIAQDETEHALLAWRVVRWILEQRPDLTDLARRTFEGAAPADRVFWASGATAQDSVLMAHGHLPEHLKASLRSHEFTHVVVPCAQALFEQGGSGSLAQRA